MDSRSSKGIGLVLGAGGARGLAHIGALRAIEEAGLKPTAVAGSSMGAIIGAMIAAGHNSDHITAIATDRSRLTLPTAGGHGGLIGHDRIIKAFCDNLPERIESLPIPFAAVAVDISSGKCVVLSEGPLRASLAASAAIPGLMKPLEIDGRNLVDGGVVNALPVDVVRRMSTDELFAIDVLPPRDRNLTFDDPRPWWQRALASITFRSRPLAVDVFLKAFQIQQSLLAEQRLSNEAPDVLVRVDLDPGLRLEDFHRFREAIDAGYRSTTATIDSL